MQLLPLLLPACLFLAVVEARSTPPSFDGLTAGEKTLANSRDGLELEPPKTRLDKLAEESEPTNPGLEEILKKIKKVQLDKDVDEEGKDIINKGEGVAGDMLEDDIILSEDDLAEIESESQAGSRTKRQATTKKNRWTNGVVNYFFEGLSRFLHFSQITFSLLCEKNRETVRVAIGMIEANTCIRYIENATATNRLRIFEGKKGCRSSVGMTGGQQSYSTGDGCSIIGQVIHELSHTLGIYHEQARSDRDDYVFVDYSQIASGKGNFNKGNGYIMTPFEYSSNMHYSANYMTGNNTGYSLVPHDINYMYGMGGRQWSFYDIQLLNEFYFCNDNCNANASAQCLNGGKPNPNYCSVCICPRGFGGVLCDEKPQGCGQTVMAATTPQNLTIVYGNTTLNSRYFQDCTYWVQAPPGYNVQIKIVSLKNTKCNFGCYYSGLEVKYMPDPRITNPRWCCKEFANTTLISYQNPTPVVPYTRYAKQTYVVEYVAIPSSQVPPAPDSITAPPGKAPTRAATTSTKSTTGTSTTSTTTTTTTTTTVKPTVATNTVINAGPTVFRDCHSALDAANCAYYKKIDWCNFMGKIDFRNVKWQCGVECGLCGQQTPECKDYESNCAAYKEAGKCNSEDPMVAEFKCPMSCGFCTNPN